MATLSRRSLGEIAMLRCQKCGHAASSLTAKFCSRCGGRLVQGVRTDSSESPTSVEQDISAAEPGERLICRARCTQTKHPFAIRFERAVGGTWYARASWIIDDKRAESDVFKGQLTVGSFKKHKDYPGCPHCGNSLFRTCFSCGKGFGCLAYRAPTYTCPWCGASSIPKWGRPSGRPIGTKRIERSRSVIARGRASGA